MWRVPNIAVPNQAAEVEREVGAEQINRRASGRRWQGPHTAIHTDPQKGRRGPVQAHPPGNSLQGMAAQPEQAGDEEDQPAAEQGGTPPRRQDPRPVGTPMAISSAPVFQLASWAPHQPSRGRSSGQEGAGEELTRAEHEL